MQYEIQPPLVKQCKARRIALLTGLQTKYTAKATGGMALEGPTAPLPHKKIIVQLILDCNSCSVPASTLQRKVAAIS